MNDFILYILKSAIWIGVFYGIYRFFFLNETFLKFNRIFLFVGMIAPFVLALCQFRYSVKVMTPILYESGSASVAAGEAIVTSSPGNLFLFGYLAGAFVLFLYYGLGLSKIRKLIGKQDSNSGKRSKIIDVPGIRSSFSFFGYVFMDSQAEWQGIEKELILAHESAHVGQRHWVDVLLAQLVCVVQWFNPFAWLYLNAVKQNHEFLADRSVIDKGYSPAIYQAVLINSTFKVPVFAFTNSFAYYYKFKRITIMKKNLSKPARKWAVLLLLPALAAFLAAFAKPEYHYAAFPLPVQPEVESLVSQDTVKETKPSKSTKTAAKVVFTPPRIETVKATKVSGQVLDADGKPIVGASIVQKDGKRGTITDTNGNFTLAVEADSELKVVYIGKEEAFVRLTGMTKGKPVSITLKDEADKPAKNVDPANTLTATYVTRDDDNNTLRMKIRGDKSNLPLFIVDGKEMTSIDHLNPDDIANISVFKDSSATSAYGEKGKNGVVIITSKRKDVDSVVKHTGVVIYDKEEARISINGIGDKATPPLYIVDDQEVTSVNHLNPEDIESVSIRKNDSATSVYGEKGKNGVIIITTKKK